MNSLMKITVKHIMLYKHWVADFAKSHLEPGKILKNC